MNSKIVDYLDLEDQLKLWKSSEPASRLRSLISYIWQRNREYTIDYYTFNDDYELLNEFLQCIRFTVTELTLQYPAMDHLERWKGHTFLDLPDIVYLNRDNIRQLLSLPKLIKLRLHNFYQLDDLLLEIGSIRGQDVLTAAFSNNIWMMSTEVLAKLRNLRCLTLVDDEGCAGIDFSTITYCFPLLEQLHLENSRIWVNADGIWDVLLACPRLREFSMINHVLDDEFFAFSKSTMNRALNQRTKPLKMHFYKTGKDDLVRT